MECVCPAAYKYTSANCSGDKKLAGSSCSDNDGTRYNDCQSQTCEERGLKTCGSACIGKNECCTNGVSGCGNDNTKKCVSGTCETKSCSDYNSAYLSALKEGYYCPQVSAGTVGGLTCYSCSQTCDKQFSGYTKDGTCADGQTSKPGTDGCAAWVKCDGEACPAEAKDCTYGCLKKNTRTECQVNSQTGYCIECTGCEACSEYPLADCPDGATCEACTKTCDSKQVKYKFTECTTGYTSNGENSCRKLTCAETGGDACDSDTQKCSGTGATATCVDKTCEDKGLKQCGTSCIAKTACCTNGSSGCASGQNCEDGTCVSSGSTTCHVGDIYSDDRLCSAEIRSGVTPIGVVVDPEQRLIIGNVGFAYYSNVSMLPSTSPYLVYNIENIPNVALSLGGESHNGMGNTRRLVNYSSKAAQFCFSQSDFDGAIIDYWYVPSTGEVQLYRKNQTTLESLNNTRPLVVAPTEKIWLSDEAYGSTSYTSGNHHTHMNIITKDSSGNLVFDTLEKGETANVRCFARYPDLTGQNTSIPCPVTTSMCWMYDITGEPGGYTCSANACPDKFFKESFYFNESCSYCSFNMEYYPTESFSCSPNSAVYYESNSSNDYFFCTTTLDTSKHPNAKAIGTVSSRGKILYYGPTVSSANEAETYCNNLAIGPYTSMWRLVSTGDNSPSQWKAAASTYARYGLEGNFYVLLNSSTHTWEPVSSSATSRARAVCTVRFQLNVTNEY